MHFKSRQERIECWVHTKKISQMFPDPPESIKFTLNPFFYAKPKFQTTIIEAAREDSISSGLRLKSAGYNPVVLNFSDYELAGGYVEYGSSAQEESLFRQTNYHRTLLQSFYPLNRKTAIYSPDVLVLKITERQNWQILENPVTLSFVACPAICYPFLVDGRYDNEDETAMRDQMRTVFQTAFAFGHDSLVLGAWGTGAWRGPKEHVAELFREVAEEFDGCFKCICFSLNCFPDRRRLQYPYAPKSEFKRAILEQFNCNVI